MEILTCYDVTNVLWRYSPEEKGDVTNILWRWKGSFVELPKVVLSGYILGYSLLLAKREW